MKHKDCRCQFHQRFKQSFFARKFQERKKIDNFTVIFKHLGSVKAARKTLMKLSPCWNFFKDSI